MLQYFARRHPACRRPLGLSHLVKVQLFSEYGHVKIESQMQQHGSKYFARSHPRP